MSRHVSANQTHDAGKPGILYALHIIYIANEISGQAYVVCKCHVACHVIAYVIHVIFEFCRGNKWCMQLPRRCPPATCVFQHSHVMQFLQYPIVIILLHRSGNIQDSCLMSGAYAVYVIRGPLIAWRHEQIHHPCCHNRFTTTLRHVDCVECRMLVGMSSFMADRLTDSSVIAEPASRLKIGTII